MSARPTPVRRDPGYTGLTTAVPSLPAHWYFDPQQYRRELERIWLRNWLYVCRSSEIAKPRSFHTFDLAEQSLFVVRGDDGNVRAFHNTCRHRGSALCRGTTGQFPAAGIVCPYHSWRYGFDGELKQTSSHELPDGFDKSLLSLYPLPVTEWNGFVFAAFTSAPPPFAASFDLPVNRLDDWRLAETVVGHRLHKTIACNWKVFWENYNECLHCPNVHPRLSQLVPIYGRALLERRDDPHWQDHAADEDARYAGGLRAGAESWTLDGKPVGVPFSGISAADRKAAYIYLTAVPSVFIVAHVDYVRTVRLLPLGPERIDMTIEFLFRPETLAEPQRNIKSAVDFTNMVLSEDAAICEVNQRGLHALAHEAGVLMPEEYVIRMFHDWVRAEFERP